MREGRMIVPGEPLRQEGLDQDVLIVQEKHGWHAMGGEMMRGWQLAVGGGQSRAIVMGGGGAGQVAAAARN